MLARRPDLLRIIGMTGTAISLSPQTAISLDDRHYVNTKLGLELERPAAWDFVSVRDFEQFRAEHSERARERELRDELRAHSDRPIVVAAWQRAVPAEGAAALAVYARPVEPLQHPSLVESVRAHEPSIARQLAEYVVERPPHVLRISGHDAVLHRYRYTARARDGRPIPLRCTDLVARTARAEFCVALEHRAADRKSRPELEAVLKSLCFW